MIPKELHDKYFLDINNFEKVTLLNKGSFGKVYLVEKITDRNIKYAVKIIETAEYHMIRRELYIIQYKHPTLIHYIGFSDKDFDNNDNITLFMEIAKRRSLYDLLHSIELSLQNENYADYNDTTRMKILLGIAFGMKKIHEHGLLHMDLKPENILLNEDLEPLISDFGLSQKLPKDKSYVKGNRIGSCIYMSPEVYSEGKYSQKADVYSFGIMANYIVNEKIPYGLNETKKENLNQLMNDICFKNKRPTFRNDVNEDLKNIIELCWEHDPKKRPSFDDIFNRLLEILEKKK